MIVVIPSNRGLDLKRLEPLIDGGARFIVVDDSEGAIRIDHPSFQVYNWADRRRMLGRLDAAIPRRNGACRAFGFLLAWKEADPEEAIVALDDDCAVEIPDFMAQIEAALSSRAWPTVRGPGRYFNLFDRFLGIDTTRTFPRGFPYASRLGYRPWAPDGCVPGTVRVNVGLWRGVLDMNALDRLVTAQTEWPDVELAGHNVVLPKGTLVSACAGNLHFRREVIPACYQLPMNIEILPGWPVNRYGDIWGGYILKSLMDIRGDLMSVGGPIVHHGRRGPLSENIAHEHLSHLMTDEFAECVTASCENIRPASYRDMMGHLREEIARWATRATPILKEYLRRLDPCLGAWLAALDT